jgi:hypothetical protein
MNSALPLVLILAVDLAFTFLHSYQEWKGAGAPLWRNFGAIVGLDISDRWGFLIFTVLLTLTLSVIGAVGILDPLGPNWTAAALGALIGARLSDTLVSHVALYGLGYRPNPGLSSTPLYVLEACFIVWAFHSRLAVQPQFAEIGFVLGALSFVLVLPGLWLARWVWPDRVRPPWSRGQPMPSWAAGKSEAGPATRPS